MNSERLNNKKKKSEINILVQVMNIRTFTIYNRWNMRDEYVSTNIINDFLKPLYAFKAAVYNILSF